MLSVSPTIPKPWTAYQYQPADRRPRLIKRRQGILKQHLAPGIELRTDSPMTARIDDVLSRADARLAPMLESMTDNSLGALPAGDRGARPRRPVPVGGRAAAVVHRRRGHDRALPAARDGQARARAADDPLPAARGRLQALRRLLIESTSI